MALRIIDRYGNGQYIAEMDGTPFLTSGMEIVVKLGQKYPKHFKTGFGTTEDSKGEDIPFAFGLGSTICAGQHPNHGKVAIKLEPGPVFFDGQPWELKRDGYEWLKFEPRELTDQEMIDGHGTKEQQHAAFNRKYGKKEAK